MDASGASTNDGSLEGSIDEDAPMSDASLVDGAASLNSGLVAYYPFDETSGTSAADASGNGHDAQLLGGAGFASGLSGNAVSMNGTGQYVNLPQGLVEGLQSFSVAVWVRMTSAVAWARIFDFGSGETAYMFLAPDDGAGAMRFAITTSGYGGEQRVDGPALSVGTWQHVAVTVSGSIATLYVGGVRAAQITSISHTPSSLGATTQDWLGRSEYSVDPYFAGLMDNFRLYGRALSGGEIQALAAGHL